LNTTWCLVNDYKESTISELGTGTVAGV